MIAAVLCFPEIGRLADVVPGARWHDRFHVLVIHDALPQVGKETADHHWQGGTSIAGFLARESIAAAGSGAGIWRVQPGKM